ncbi:MAG TPA: BON domain-containing protein [Steroidobacteraceae bacterium]|jgi:osmotically-inducible protein OsmY|nr:BON domain-containing protein [Steroidobacteraceae bacterium]
MRRLGFAAATVGALVLLAGCVAAVIGSSPHSGTAADTRARSSAGTDAGLAAAVQSRIAADAALGAEALEVSVQGGAVTLRGLVASSAERNSAERLVRTVAGVTAVNNLLKVK